MFDPSFQTIWGGNLTAVFCDTGWEHPDTYKHVNDVCLQMGVRLITLKSKYDFVSLAVHKKRFPSTNARFCTSELKMKPMIDYVLSLKESCIIIQGIRAGESTARAAMEEECMYFKSYFQPNKKGRTENYRSKDVKEWCSQFDASVLRPIFKWSAQQVIDCILDAGQKPNPLYYRGFSRVGCFPCIMCRHKEIELIAKNELKMNEIELDKIYNEDCQEGIKRIPDASIDCILTDPPYLYLKGQKLERKFDEQTLFSGFKRVLKPTGFVVMFGRGTSFYRWNTILSDLGFKFKEEIIWDKGYCTSPLMRLSRIHETYLFIQCLKLALINAKFRISK